MIRIRMLLYLKFGIKNYPLFLENVARIDRQKLTPRQGEELSHRTRLIILNEQGWAEHEKLERSFSEQIHKSCIEGKKSNLTSGLYKQNHTHERNSSSINEKLEKTVCIYV